MLGVTFDAILTAEDIGSYKPSPTNFDALDHRERHGVATLGSIERQLEEAIVKLCDQFRF